MAAYERWVIPKIAVVLTIIAVAIFPTGTLPPPIVPAAQAQGTSVAALGALAALLGQVQQGFTQALISGDEAAKNRIRQASVEADALITRIQEAIKDTSDRAETLRAGVAKDATDFLHQTADFTQQFADDSFLEVNETLLNASVVIAQLPFVSRPDPFVLAIRPLRMGADTQSRQVEVHGYFPDASESDPVTVMVGGKRIPASEGINHSVTFELPRDLLKPSSFVPFVVEVPVRNGIWSRITHKTLPVAARLYVENPQPFAFQVQFFQPNANQRAIIRVSVPIKFTADSSNTSNRQTLTAPNLFSRTINNNQDYDMSTARFESMGSSIDQGNKPCDCCDTSSGTLDSWDANVVSFSLSAPTCGPKSCSLTYFCGGGGTHADIYLTPTFSVQRRGQPAEVEQGVAVAPARRRDAVTIPLPTGWTSASVEGRYADGDDKRGSVRRLTPGVTQANSDLWSAQIQGSNLVISTR